MIAKSDNPQEIGRHVFERAGLGRAPFKFVDFYVARYCPAPGVVMCGAGCEFCGEGIMNVCVIEGADGKRFKVGTTCVEKTGDAGLIRAFKTSPQVREQNRQRAVAKDDAVKAEWAKLMADDAARTKLAAAKASAWDGGEQSWLAKAERAWPMCGASGRAGYLRAAKKILADAILHA